MSETSGRPLSGVRVLDFTQFLAGPFATMILGDLGADVIKIETPEGELARHLPPHFVGSDSLYYLSVNRNKHSLAVDLKSDEGRALVDDLIDGADVVVENFRPGVMKRLGFDPAVMTERFPRLVWCSISGFGQDGPSRDLPAYDMIVQALSGGMSLTGMPDGESVRAGIPLGDLSAGMFGVIGILAALFERERSGRGKVVDVSMLDCQISMLTYQAAYYLHSGVVPGRQGRGHDSIPTYRSFTAGDGRDVVVTANTEDMWRRLCKALDREQLTADPRFATNADRFANRSLLDPILDEAFQCAGADAWVARLRQAGVPVGEVKTLDRALNDDQVKHRGMVLELKSAGGERVQVAGNPIKFRGDSFGPDRYPPALGGDTREILRSRLKLPDDRIDALIREGVVIERTANGERDAAA